MSRLSEITQQRLNMYETVHNSLKVNRFVNNQWSSQSTLVVSKNQLNEMIRLTYMSDNPNARVGAQSVLVETRDVTRRRLSLIDSQAFSSGGL